MVAGSLFKFTLIIMLPGPHDINIEARQCDNVPCGCAKGNHAVAGDGLEYAMVCVIS
jgi:hypothetical protein